VIFYLDGTPRGWDSIINESHAAAAIITATNHTGTFLDGDSFYPGNSGAVVGLDASSNMMVFQKVGSCGATGQYTVNIATGVYSFCGTAPTGTVYINYDWGLGAAGVTGNAYIKAENSWANDSSSNFSDALCSGLCGTPGLLYPGNSFASNLLLIKSYEALDSGDGSHNALHGALDNSPTAGLHPSPYGKVIVANAIQTAIQTAYPSLTSQANSPTANNWNACTTTASITYSSAASACGGTTAGPFVGTMINGAYNLCPTSTGGMAIFVDGKQAATSVTGGTWASAPGFSNAVTGGAWNCGTGAWSITFTSNLAAGKRFTIAQDPTNLSDNGLMDTAQGGVALPANVTGNPLPKSWALVNFSTCMTNSMAGTGTPGGVQSFFIIVTTGTVADVQGTWPAITLELHGALNGTGCSAGQDYVQLTDPFENATNRFIPPNRYRAMVSKTVAAGANGHLNGVEGAGNFFTLFNSSFTASWATGATTGMSNSAGMGAGTFADFTDLNLNTNVIGQIQKRVELTPPIMIQDATISAASAVNQPSIEVEKLIPVSVTVTFWRAGARQFAN
jgi:hypothetical protein